MMNLKTKQKIYQRKEINKIVTIKIIMKNYL